MIDYRLALAITEPVGPLQNVKNTTEKKSPEKEEFWSVRGEPEKVMSIVIMAGRRARVERERLCEVQNGGGIY